MKNHKILNLIKDFDPKGHHYKNNSLARSFGWWWTEQCLENEYERLDEIVDQVARDVALSNLNELAREIAAGYNWTASNAIILNWFKTHETKRHRQLIRAYMLLPYVRLNY